MKKVKSVIPYIAVFGFFAIILFLSPISGDDWGNYLVGKEGLYHSIGNAIGMYFDWEGRFMSRILINILTYNKVLWNLFNAFVIAAIVYLTIKLLKPRNKNLSLFLSLFIILFMNIYTFSQIIVWIAGNITYLFPILFLLYYFYRILRRKNDKSSMILILGFLNLIIPMFVEHVAGVLVIFNVIINITYLVKYKKINKPYLAYLIISILSMTFMYFSPGNMKRSSIENLVFNDLSLVGKIIYNIPNFIYYTFMINPYMVLLTIWTNYYLTKNFVSNKYIKISTYLYLIIIPIFITIFYLLSNFTDYSIFSVFNQNNIFVIFYYFSYIIMEFVLLFLFSKKRKEFLPILFYLLGIMANSIMLLSPTWGYRTSFLTYLLLSISFIFIIDYYCREKRFIQYALLGLASCVCLFYLILYINVYRAQQNRQKEIKEQLNNKIIYIERLPSYANCNINPENEFHLGKFKEYYGIDAKTQVKIVDGDWDYIIFYHS